MEDEKLNTREKNYANHSPSSSQDFGPNREKGDPNRKQSVINMKLQNPLSGMSHDELMTNVEQCAKEHNLEYPLDDLRKGALVAQNKAGFENFDQLIDEDKTLIREEKLHRWRQPRMMYYMTSKPPIVSSKNFVRRHFLPSPLRRIGHCSRHGSVCSQRRPGFLLPILWYWG